MPGRLRGITHALILVSLLSVLVAANRALAQDGSLARISPADTRAFPRISAYLDVRDAAGSFVYNLGAENVTILEDNQLLPASELSLLRPGVQLVVAINPGSAFAIRDVHGLSRYDHVVQALLAWAQARAGTTLDDLSLLANGGLTQTHLADFASWATALQSYQPDSRNAIPDYDILGSALEIAADPPTQAGMGRAVLFVTALPERDTGIGLQSLAARASQRGIRVFIWLVSSPAQFTSQDAHLLEDLADQTGGAVAHYSGLEPLPDPEQYLEPLRNTYALTYSSRLTASGSHRLAVQVQVDGVEATTPEQQFDLEVLPPNIAFISPPTEIRRAVPAGSEATAAELAPVSQELEILIEFPDGFERPLKHTVLYIDGEAVDKNTLSPFDRFTWDLSGYADSGRHTLKAEALDSLGLSNASLEISIPVRVERPALRVLSNISVSQKWLAGLAVVLAGAILLLVLIIGGRLQPETMRALRAARRRARRVTDPVTQPVRVKPEPSPQRLPSWINRFHWPQRRLAPQAYALLVRFSETEQEPSVPPIAVTSDEITFGSDPTRATHVLDDSTVEDLHARLRRLEDGSFLLSDEGSIAGTWINYAPTSKEGMRLEHGDLIHLGRVIFRFMLREPERIRRPVVTLEEPRP